MTDADAQRDDTRSNGAVHPDEDPFLAARAQMLRELRASDIRDPELLAAFARVPRESFVPPGLVGHAYDDSALGIGRGQTISQPYIVARMTALLDLPARSRGEGRPAGAGRLRVLDVGTGSGYQAAILAELGVEVVSVERDVALADEAAGRLATLGYAVRCVVGDGSVGWPEDAPYDGIVVAAAAPAVPEPLVAQLADGGHLVLPVGTRERQSLHLLVRTGSRLDERVLDPCVFVPLVGRHGFPG